MNSLSISVKNYLEYCHTQKGLNPKTLKAYSTDLHQFISFFNHSNPHELSLSERG